VTANHFGADQRAALLAGHGYQIRYTAELPIVCIVHGHGERWLGLGDSPDDALSDALAQALPSHLGRALLELSLAESCLLAPGRDGIEGPAAEEPAVEKPATSEPAVEDPRREAPKKSPQIQMDSAAEVPEPAPPPALADSEPAPLPHAEPPAHQEPEAPAELTVRPSDSDPPVEEDLPAHYGEALEQLAVLRQTIGATLGELATCSAPIQRLQLTAWVARARAIETHLADDREVESAVSSLLQKLTDLAKRWWPGTVEAMFMESRPLGIGEALPVPALTRTWLQVEATVESLLAEHEPLATNGESLDWCDDRCLSPAALDADSQLGEVKQVVENALGSTSGEVPRWSRSKFDISQSACEELARAASQLRWIREDVLDQRLWAQLFGRLRWLLWHNRRAPDSLRNALDHRWRPDGSWAAWLGFDPEERQRRRRVQAVLVALDALGAAPTAKDLARWLVDAFAIRAKALHGKSLAALVHQHASMVAELTASDLPEENRRTRRRLRGLRADLGAVDGDAATEQVERLRADLGDDQELAEPPNPADTLAATLRPQLDGQRALFVSNRRDSEIIRALQRLVGLDTEIVVNKPARVRSACEAIGRGRYDLVMAATGFIGHKTERSLVVACRGSGTPFVRAYKGRPLACLRALARDLR